MRTWTRTVVLLGFVVAGCTQILGVGGFHEAGGDGGMMPGSDGGTIDTHSASGVCDPVEQTGCSGSTPRCTWIQNGAGSGHVGCVDAGTVPLGGVCGSDGTGSGYPEWDNCVGGNFCTNGACEAICDPSLGVSVCSSNHFCQIYDGVFAGSDGLCDPGCDPLADNSFGDGGDTIPLKTGSACTAAQGCYGAPSNSAVSPTHFTCAPVSVETDVHRSACVPGSGGPSCGPAASEVYLNGCAQGYEPLLLDTPGSTQIDCIAFCQPHDCYAGNCPDTAKGVAPHACSTANVRVATSYNFPSGANDGYNQCLYLWLYEVDDSGNIVQSPYDDYGICYDDAIYPYTGSDGTEDIPISCSTLPGSGSGGPDGFNASDFGCLSVATAGALGDLGSGTGPSAVSHRSLKHKIHRDIRFPTHALLHPTF